MKLHYLQFAIAVTGALAVTAQVGADDKLVVTGTDSKQTAISIADVSRITFNGDKMKIATTKGDLDYQLGAIDNLAFDLEASAADRIETSLRNDITLGISGGILSVSAPAGVPLSVAVYNLKGVAVARHTGFENISIDFNPMAPGIYIVTANGKTIKFTR